MWSEQETKPETISKTLNDPRVCPRAFPNVTTLLHLLLLTSVTVAGVERANSSLRFVKSDFISTMGEDRFNALILLFIHQDFSLDIDTIIDTYARKRPRRMLLLNSLS